MKHAAFLLGAILLFVTTSFAQDNSANSILSTASNSDAAFSRPTSASVEPLFLASAIALASAEPLAAPALGSDLSSGGEPAARRPIVYSVFENYKWQVYGGYAFFRFYALPHRTETMNGIDVAISYFPTSNWFGADGDILAEFGNFQHQSSKFTSYLGGGRVRRRFGPPNVEIWAHGLAGFAKFLPQTALGGQLAFSYQVGGGVDLGIPRRRLAYRVQADMVGTRFFHTNQWSPKISIGLVYKF